MTRAKIRILFVCTGNLCRSPMAQGLLDQRIREAGLASRVEVDSAGTGSSRAGEAPDRRAQAAARRRSIDIGMQRARQVQVEDFQGFDYILAMDRENYAALRAICPAGLERKLHLCLDFAPALRLREVPDPYYGNERGFERVLDLMELVADGLLQELEERL